MSKLPMERMTVDEFIAWGEGRTGRHDLVDGRLFAMAPERVRHTRSKFAVVLVLLKAIERENRPCEVLPDGATVRIDRFTAYKPDALVRCGPPLDGNAIETPDPLVIVEVLSPSTSRYDKGIKLAGYFTLPSLHHYLIVDPDRRLVIHHRRNGEEIATRVLTVGTLRLDPPGLDLAVEAMVGPG